jgi:hypothetical protein
MILNKSQLKSSGQSWFPSKRYRVNTVVNHNDLTWQNTTGKNTEPGIGSDWLAINITNVDDLLTLSNLVKETPDTGTVVDLSYVGGHTTNVLTPNAVTGYTSIINPVLNGNQTTLINAPTEPTVSSFLSVTLSGTSGSARLNIGAFSFDFNFITSLTQTAATFDSTQGGAVEASTGLVVTNFIGSIILTGQFTGVVSIENLTGDLNGIVSGIQAKKVFGAEFIPDTDMKMCFEYNGHFVEYYFLKYIV